MSQHLINNVAALIMNPGSILDLHYNLYRLTQSVQSAINLGHISYKGD